MFRWTHRRARRAEPCAVVDGDACIMHPPLAWMLGGNASAPSEDDRHDDTCQKEGAGKRCGIKKRATTEGDWLWGTGGDVPLGWPPTPCFLVFPTRSTAQHLVLPSPYSSNGATALLPRSVQRPAEWETCTSYFVDLPFTFEPPISLFRRLSKTSLGVATGLLLRTGLQKSPELVLDTSTLPSTDGRLVGA